MIGKTVSHYRIVDKIGQGGMGVVYKAEDTKLHRTVALKFLPAHLLGETNEMARFVHEARAAASLSHPNICTIYEIEETGAQPFIAMEYVEGRNLKDIAAEGPLPLERALRYATQMARGLEEAHAKGVVHRDVKSANVVVSKKDHAIVMDFGLAKLQGQTKLTRTGTTVGTVAYMSPEQARGEDVDHRSDIWSLGVVLYRMVAGRYPFEGEHQSAVMYSIMNEPHTPLSAVRPGVPEDLERIVDKALAKKASERYQSVGDLAVDLKALRNRISAPRPSAAGASKGSSRLGRAAIAIAAVVVAAGLFGWWQLGRRGSEPVAEREVPKDERVSIAVLPLQNMSRDPEQEYFADGMTEALIAQLAQIRALRVISRTSVMRFKDTTEPIPEIAEKLGVNTIIEGSVLQAGDRVRVTAQLIDAKTDEHLWAQSYERDMSDVLGLQSAVARAIADEVKVELTPGESERLAATHTVDPRAYDLYLRGRYHWNRRTRPDLERALTLFHQAVDIQPDYAMAYAAIAQTYLVMADWSSLPPREAYPGARDMARKALDLDADLGAAWAALAGVESEYEWDWEKGEEYYRKAIELEPNNASAHQWYAEFLAGQGRFSEAVDEIELARQIDPLAMIMGAVEVWIYTLMEDFDHAIATAEQVLELDPTFTSVYYYLALACQYAGKGERAADAYARFYGRAHPTAEASIRKAYATGGMDAVTRTIIGGNRAQREKAYASPAVMGFLFASLGEADSAMVWLNRAYDIHAYPLSVAAVTISCKPIRDDPRFLDLLKRMKLDDVKPGYARK
jgi:TolB-like protein/tRNA A-37 threonylcarbamoyl transferase component Bud32